jgi:hypothetical protein
VVDGWLAFGGDPVDGFIVDLFILFVKFGQHYFSFSSMHFQRMVLSGRFLFGAALRTAIG